MHNSHHHSENPLSFNHVNHITPCRETLVSLENMSQIEYDSEKAIEKLREEILDKYNELAELMLIRVDKLDIKDDRKNDELHNRKITRNEKHILKDIRILKLKIIHHYQAIIDNLLKQIE
jgi:hypothetical protein